MKYGRSVDETQCRGCTGNIETQEHCTVSVLMPVMKSHHDKVTGRLVDAIPDSLGTKFFNQTVQDFPGLLRPFAARMS